MPAKVTSSAKATEDWMAAAGCRLRDVLIRLGFGFCRSAAQPQKAKSGMVPNPSLESSNPREARGLEAPGLQLTFREFLAFVGHGRTLASIRLWPNNTVRQMKLSAANIPLTVFAALATGLVGVLFCVAPLSALPYTIRAHGLVSFMPIMDIIVACAGLAGISLSVGLALRRRWAHGALVRLMAALIVVFVLALGRKALQEGRTSSERLMDVTVGPCLVIVMGVVLLFLLNRRVQDELTPQPNKAADRMPGNAPGEGDRH